MKSNFPPFGVATCTSERAQAPRHWRTLQRGAVYSSIRYDVACCCNNDAGYYGRPEHPIVHK